MLLQGCCRYKRSDLPAAVELFSHALQISRDTPEPTHALRAELLSWRARCYRHQRHWNAARADIDAALDLAQIAEDEHLIAHLHFQSSIVNERLGQTHIACCLAEQARDIYERIGDRRRLARILNNLGGLNCLLGRTEVAVELLRDAYALASELGQTADAAQAISSLAQVELEAGRPAEAETSALEAIALLEGRADYAEERGNATLVLARALFQLGRHDESERAVRQAEAIFSSVSAQSCVAATLVTRGDIRRGAGNVDEAADLYRKAAELLQDFHF